MGILAAPFSRVVSFLFYFRDSHKSCSRMPVILIGVGRFRILGWEGGKV